MLDNSFVSFYKRALYRRLSVSLLTGTQLNSADLLSTNTSFQEKNMKGNAIIGQSGGPTSVTNSSLSGVVQHSLQSNKINHIYGMRFGIEGFMNDEVIDLGAEDSVAIEGLRHTPSSALGSCRYKLQEKDFPLIFEKLKKSNMMI